MAYTIDTTTARIEAIRIEYHEDGTVYVVQVQASVKRADGSEGETGVIFDSVEIPAGAIKTQLVNLAAIALGRIKAARRWT